MIDIKTIKLYAPIKLYLLKYNAGIYVSLDFQKSLEAVNKSIIKINSLRLESNQYHSWRQKITGKTSSKLLTDDLYDLNYNLQYYFQLNVGSNLRNSLPVEVKRKVLKDAFFIENGFDFYSDFWYLEPYLTIEQTIYYELIDKSNLLNLTLTGEASGLTNLTANWIVEKDKDGIPLDVFRIIDPGLAARLKKELESKFLHDKEREDPNIKLLDDFLTKEINRQAIVLIQYTE
ncbi:MAG: hypothetical protein JST32_09760 [Bacteroidetes bacterium]|nr:hypothetical protein [Bacteroidota bacterium]